MAERRRQSAAKRLAQEKEEFAKEKVEKEARESKYSLEIAQAGFILQTRNLTDRRLKVARRLTLMRLATSQKPQ